MQRKIFQLLMMISVIILSGLACLEVKDENAGNAGNLNEEVSTSPTPTDLIPTSPVPSPNIVAVATPTQTVEPMPTTSPEPEPSLTEVPVVTPSPQPTPTRSKTRCELDMEAIQVAIEAYSAEYDQWPTVDGQPGPIDWEKMIPDYMDEMPYANNKCEWGVNSNPVGLACMGKRC